MREFGVGQIASLTGRYYAMDRDNRWERIEKRLPRHGAWRSRNARSADPVDAVRRSYEQGVTDEFVLPVGDHHRRRGPPRRPWPRSATTTP